VGQRPCFFNKGPKKGPKAASLFSFQRAK